jgi:IS605 OrfB family transposase
MAAIGAANATRVDVSAYQAETKRLVAGLSDEATAVIRKERNDAARVARQGHTTALTWRFVRDAVGWTAFVSVNSRLETTDFGFGNGAIGLDLNVGFITFLAVDRFGNPLKESATEFPIETAALSSDRAKAAMGEAVKLIVDAALEQRRPIVIERLDFSKKKAALKETCGSNLARRLSSFSYNLFQAMVRSRAARFGVRVVDVNPAYTSHIGRAKYARPLGISVHRAAAAMVARRGMGLSEGLSASPELPLGNGRHVALPRPVRIGRRHVWVSWGRHYGRYKAARNALAAADRKVRSGGARNPAIVGDPVPSGWANAPDAMSGEIRHVAPTAARGTAVKRLRA